MNMNTPVGLQLYTVRDAMAQNFESTIRSVAAWGYVGVEAAGFPDGVTPADAKKLFDELGLVVSGAHRPLPLGDEQNAVLDWVQALGCTHLVCPWLNPDDHWSTLDQVKATAEMLNEAAAVASANGLTFSYHNHDFEFREIDGTPAYFRFLDLIDPAVHLEVDVYWVHLAGHDPAQVVADLGSRAPLLHIKDGPAVREEPMTAVGDGVVDIPAVVKAGAASAEWLIVELDACATDMLTAVEQSIGYMAAHGLGRVNKA